MRNNMINTLGEDYVTFAEANGLRGRTVALLYAARNALLPNVTAFGLSLGAVVGGSVLVEGVFSYPGIGNLLFIAVTNHDFPLMQALFLVITREHAGRDLHRRPAVRPARPAGAPMNAEASTEPLMTVISAVPPPHAPGTAPPVARRRACAARSAALRRPGGSARCGATARPASAWSSSASSSSSRSSRR